MKGLLERVRPNIMAVVLVLGAVAVALVLQREVEAAIGAAGLIATLGNRILESQDKPGDPPKN